MRLALAAVLVACHGAPAGDPDPVLSAAELAVLRASSPAALPAAPADVSNRFADDPRAAALGQKFFFDPGFSGALLEGDNDGSATTLGVRGETGKVACAGCHVAAAGFLDDRTQGRQISLAAGWVLRRTPSLLDVGQARLIMWDGRRDSLYGQIFGPLESAKEMNSSRLFLAEQIAQRYATEYEAIFGALPQGIPPLPQTGCDKQGLCHGMPGDGAEYDALSPAARDAVTRVAVNFGKSIAAYERRLSCGPAPFDAWMHGGPAVSRAAQRGAALFAGKAKCASCHAGPFFADGKFHNVGLAPATVAVTFIDLNDRGAATGFAALLEDPLNTRGAYSDGDDGRLPAPPGAAQEGAFRTPGLRCLQRRPSYMHTGQLRAIEDVVAFFDKGGHPAGYPGTSEIAPLALSDLEHADLAAFLRTLEGPGPAQALLGPP